MILENRLEGRSPSKACRAVGERPLCVPTEEFNRDYDHGHGLRSDPAGLARTVDRVRACRDRIGPDPTSRGPRGAAILLVRAASGLGSEALLAGLPESLVGSA